MRDSFKKLGLMMLLVLWLGALTPVLVAQRHLSHEDQCLHRMRTLALAMQMYLQDYDEVFPLAFGRDLTGNWLWDVSSPVPHNWMPPFPSRDAAYASMWANVLIPYLPAYGAEIASRYDWLYCPATIAKKSGLLTYGEARRRPAKVSYTYNGLLHRLMVGQVESLATVPILWEGSGRTYFVGFAYSNPTLRCGDRNIDCRYRPRQPDGSCPLQGSMFTADSMWIHPKGTVMAYADGHVSWRRLGLAVAPNNTDPDYDPYTGYNSAGVPSYFWWDGCHPRIFRPY